METSSADTPPRAAPLFLAFQVAFAAIWSAIALWSMTHTNDQVFVILNLFAFLGFIYTTSVLAKDLLATLRVRPRPDEQPPR